MNLNWIKGFLVSCHAQLPNKLQNDLVEELHRVLKKL